jgi:hypothetical protein
MKYRPIEGESKEKKDSKKDEPILDETLNILVTLKIVSAGIAILFSFLYFFNEVSKVVSNNVFTAVLYIVIGIVLILLEFALHSFIVQAIASFKTWPKVSWAIASGLCGLILLATGYLSSEGYIGQIQKKPVKNFFLTNMDSISNIYNIDRTKVRERVIQDTLDVEKGKKARLKDVKETQYDFIKMVNKEVQKDKDEIIDKAERRLEAIDISEKKAREKANLDDAPKLKAKNAYEKKIEEEDNNTRFRIRSGSFILLIFSIVFSVIIGNIQKNRRSIKSINENKKETVKIKDDIKLENTSGKSDKTFRQYLQSERYAKARELLKDGATIERTMKEGNVSRQTVMNIKSALGLKKSNFLPTQGS